VESDGHLVYDAARLEVIRDIFGDRIYNAIERSPMRMREIATSRMPQITQCVRASFSQQSFQDAILCLDVGPAVEFARILFPQTSHMTAPLENESYTGASTLSEHEGISTSRLEDHAYFTLTGASVSAISSIFNPTVGDAIKKSDLREWEKGHLLLDTTDCVTMELHRKEPHCGTIRLRVQCIAGVQIAHILYNDSL